MLVYLCNTITFSAADITEVNWFNDDGDNQWENGCSFKIAVQRAYS